MRIRSKKAFEKKSPFESVDIDTLLGIPKGFNKWGLPLIILYLGILVFISLNIYISTKQSFQGQISLQEDFRSFVKLTINENHMEKFYSFDKLEFKINDDQNNVLLNKKLNFAPKIEKISNNQYLIIWKLDDSSIVQSIPELSKNLHVVITTEYYRISLLQVIYNSIKKSIL